MLATLVLLCAAPISVAAAPAAEARTVVLVRHAEKAADSKDPELSPGGRERAAALARAVADLDIAAVIVSDTRRTGETGAPAAAARGLTPLVVPVAGGAQAHVKGVADAVRGVAAGGAVLVVGHSNTLPLIVAALGGPSIPDLCEKEFSPMYVLEISAKGGSARLLRAWYGPADPPSAAACRP